MRCYSIPVIALLQRVTEASVDIDAQRVAAIGAGLLVLVGVRPDDGGREAEERKRRGEQP